LEQEIVYDFYQQLVFSAAILGGFAITFLGMMLTEFEVDKKVLLGAIAMMSVASVFLIVATLGSTLILTSVKSYALTFDFSDWPGHLLRSKFISEMTFFAGMIALLLGVGCSGFGRSRTTGYITGGTASLGILFLLIIFLPTF
jgi:hypothetical protein